MGSQTTEPDDAALGALVRDVADSWRMPPRRLDQRTWLDRLDERPTGRGRGTRLMGAAAMAVAATVVLAVGAVWLRSQAETPVAGASPSAGQSAAPTPSRPPAASPLPAFASQGEPIGVPAVLVAGEGHRVVDLEMGSIGAALESPTQSASRFFALPGGGWRCVCLTYDRPLSQDPTVATLDIVRYDSRGLPIGSTRVTTYGPGLVEPAISELGGVVSVSAWPAADPDHVFVGWTVREPDGWSSGVDLVDLAAGRVVSTLVLPGLGLQVEAADPADGTRPTWADAPRVVAAPDGTSVVATQARGVTLDRQGYTELDRKVPDRWSASIDGTRLGAAVPFATGEGTLDPAWCPNAFGEAYVGSAIFVAICPSEGAIRRVDLQGRPVSDVAIPGLVQDSFVTFVDHGASRFLWEPFERTLHLVDLVAGRLERTIAVEPTAAAVPAATDPLDALARELRSLARGLADRLAPPAAAKILLDPALAISPDGRRLYLATVTGEAIESPGGSGGIAIVDTEQMAVVGGWAPLADITSITVSRDGGLVYVTGAPGVDASGTPSSEHQASLVVHDAADGTPRVVAGQLGGSYLTLDPLAVP